MSKDIQYRGHCQCCGNQQAVPRNGKNRMSKHGYTVKHGWFEGVCSGHHFSPIETDRTQADTIVATVRKDVQALLERAEALKTGRVFPTNITREGARLPGPGFKREVIVVPFAKGESWEKQEAIRAETYFCESRARAGTSFADGLERIANDYHGKPLIEVTKPAPTAPILAGERRRYGPDTRVLTARYQDGARVYYEDERGFRGWVGTQAWRKMELLS